MVELADPVDVMTVVVIVAVVRATTLAPVHVNPIAPGDVHIIAKVVPEVIKQQLVCQQNPE